MVGDAMKHLESAQQQQVIEWSMQELGICGYKKIKLFYLNLLFMP